jgi:16S rRNA (guanine527-N7)-methyltransferase
MEMTEEQIARGLAEMGIAVPTGVVPRLVQHLKAVYDTNAVMNLTSIDAGCAVALHVLDSCSAVSWLRSAPAGPFADLGSGPGYPGIPLSLITGRPVSLVESVGKKAAFLERVAAALCLEATVHPVRAEELALEMPNAFAAVTARALSALPSLVELAAPLLAPDGVLICLKGRCEAEELRRGDVAGIQCGLERTDRVDVVVPGVEAARTIVVYRRSGSPKVRLPRRNGMAQRQPLA